MLIVYDSLTGNVKRFIEKLDMRSVKIHKELKVDEPFVLVTYTTKFGETPKTTSDFLIKKNRNLIAVASSGNRLWGMKFAVSANQISEKYNVPIILKFELSGNEVEVDKFIQEVNTIDERTKMDSKE